MKVGLLKETFFNKMNYAGTLAVRSMVGKIVARSVANALKGAVLPTAMAAYRNRRRIAKGIGYASNIVSLKRPATSSPMETPVRTPRRQGSASRGRTVARTGGSASVRSASMRSRTRSKVSRSTSMVKQKDTHKGRQGVTGHRKKTKTKTLGKMPKGVKGVSSRIENRGNIAGGDCVYIGHGVPLQKVWSHIWLTVVKDLFASKGTDMFDPTKVIPGTNAYFITVSFYADFGADALDSFQVVTTLAVTTFFDLADLLITAYMTKFGAAPFVNSHPYVDRISLDQFTNAPTNTLSVNHSILYASRYTINIICKSSLKFLNATPATAINAADVVNDSTEDIRAHPLVGYKYESKKESVIIPAVRQDSVSAWPGFSLPIGTGYFHYNDSTLGTGGPSTVINHFKKPPVNGVFSNVGKRIPVNMEPGEILTDICLWEKKMSLKTWIQKYHQQGRSSASNPAIPVMIPMGAMNLIALEHKLFFTGDASVYVEYQQDLTFYTWSKHTLKKNSIMFTQVNPAIAMPPG